jgi:hypothetical protein
VSDTRCARWHRAHLGKGTRLRVPVASPRPLADAIRFVTGSPENGVEPLSANRSVSPLHYDQRAFVPIGIQTGRVPPGPTPGLSRPGPRPVCSAPASTKGRLRLSALETHRPAFRRWTATNAFAVGSRPRRRPWMRNGERRGPAAGVKRGGGGMYARPASLTRRPRSLTSRRRGPASVTAN